MKTIPELQKEIDELYAAGSSEALEKRLLEMCREYDEEQTDSYLSRSILYNELGSFYRGKARYEEGEKAFLKAKELLENSGDEELVKSANYATTLNNLAGLYRMSGSFEASLDYFTRAQKLYDTHPDTDYKTLASCHNNIALLFIRMKEADKALAELRTAAEMIEGKPGNEYVTSVTLCNTGFALQCAGKMKEAADKMEEAACAAAIVPGKESDLYRTCVHFAGVFRKEAEGEK
ncbi:MAG: tetratricopeptide repeat protein [Lachnospiraceae bacterium]|nr:tetratricopeptide repeat protein [Lachnospiraceae bacterium]